MCNRTHSALHSCSKVMNPWSHHWNRRPLPPVSTQQDERRAVFQVLSKQRACGIVAYRGMKVLKQTSRGDETCGNNKEFKSGASVKTSPRAPQHPLVSSPATNRSDDGSTPTQLLPAPCSVSSSPQDTCPSSSPAPVCPHTQPHIPGWGWSIGA